MPLDDWVAERDALFALTREAEEAARRSAEAQSSVALRVRMLESNMRLVEAYGSASSPTQRMVEGAVIERHRRRTNILHSHVDDLGHPLDVDTDEEADEDIRRSLLEEGYIRIDAPAGQSPQRAWYARRDSAMPEVLRFVSPRPFVPPVVEEATAETSSDEEAEEVAAPEPEPMSAARREALVTQLQREIDEVRSQQSPRQELARREASWRRDAEVFMSMTEVPEVPYDLPPAAAVVPQEEEQEPVWYYRRAREMALEEAERMQEPFPEPLPQPALLNLDATTPPVMAMRAGQERYHSLMAEATASSQRRSHVQYGSSRLWVRESVRRDLKAILHVVQQKLEVEQDRSAAGETFPEGSYLELADLLRDMFVCVDRI